MLKKIKKNKRRRWLCLADRFDLSGWIVGAEIGVFTGTMSRELLTLMPNLHLTMVDRWIAYSKLEIDTNQNSRMSTRDQKFFDGAYRETVEAVKRFGTRARIIRETSIEAANGIPDGTLDFAFIDADHSYMGCKNDIEAWRPKIKKGGYLCGHDYTRSGVKKAVKKFFKDSEIEEGGDKTWFVKIA